MYTTEAEGRIRNHDKESPLFLYLAYQAVHSANRPQEGLQAPQDWINKFRHIKHPQRRIYAAVVAYMDYGIGRVNFTHGLLLTGESQHRCSQDPRKIFAIMFNG